MSWSRPPSNHPFQTSTLMYSSNFISYSCVFNNSQSLELIIHTCPWIQSSILKHRQSASGNIPEEQWLFFTQQPWTTKNSPNCKKSALLMSFMAFVVYYLFLFLPCTWVCVHVCVCVCLCTHMCYMLLSVYMCIVVHAHTETRRECQLTSLTLLFIPLRQYYYRKWEPDILSRVTGQKDPTFFTFHCWSYRHV